MGSARAKAAWLTGFCRFCCTTICCTVIGCWTTAHANAVDHDNVKVFLDCESGCDRTYLKREITYVDYVRDRQDADVHLLILRQSSASGRRYQLSFLGSGRFETLQQVLSFNSPNTDTDDERRRGLTRTIALGLVPYVAQTSLGQNLNVRYDGADEPSQETELRDPWNHWVYSSRIGTNLSDQDRQDSTELSGSFYANRTTEAWRIGYGLDHNFRERNFLFDDGTSLKDVSRSSNATLFAIKSIGNHWGVGAGISSRRSVFRNLERGYRVAAAIEHNVYPYSESAQRELTMGYFVGHMFLNYDEETVFGLLTEHQSNHGVFVDYDLEQPWGDVSVELTASQFLKDADIFRVNLRGNLDYRIARGFSVSLWARTTLIRDQIYLPRGGTSDEDVLLGRRALDTGFETRFGVTLRYTFGSIYSNVVNSRLRGTGFTSIF